MISKNIKKGLIIIIPVIFLVIITSLLFIFDCFGKIDVLRHPEKYSFRTNFASFFIQNDYYIGKEMPKGESFYRDLKDNEKKYSEAKNDTELKLSKFNNIAFDIYHDILSMNYKNQYQISIDDYIFLGQNDIVLTVKILYLNSLKTIPENYKTLFAEFELRREVIKTVQEDLKKRKIDATININDVNFENLTPVYIDEQYKPNHIKDFEKIIIEKVFKNYNNYITTNNLKCHSRTPIEKATSCYLEVQAQAKTQYWQEIDNLDESWKHRYTVLAIEKKKSGDKIFHLYEVHPYKEGNRHYWDIQYYPPSSDFLKGYLKMLELLMNL